MNDFHLTKIRDALLRLDLPLSVDVDIDHVAIVDTKGVNICFAAFEKVQAVGTCSD